MNSLTNASGGHSAVMAGLVPAIHVVATPGMPSMRDRRAKRGRSSDGTLEGPDLDLCRAAVFCEQAGIDRIVTVNEEGSRAAVATLGDMVRMTGNDDTGEAGHAARCRHAPGNKCTVTEILPAVARPHVLSYLVKPLEDQIMRAFRER